MDAIRKDGRDGEGEWEATGHLLTEHVSTVLWSCVRSSGVCFDAELPSQQRRPAVIGVRTDDWSRPSLLTTMAAHDTVCLPGVSRRRRSLHRGYL